MMIFFLIFLLFVPTFIIMIITGRKNKLSWGKSVYLLTAMFLQTFLAKEVPDLLGMLSGLSAGITFMILSAVKSFIFCKKYKEKKKPVFVLFMTLDLCLVIVLSLYMPAVIEDIKGKVGFYETALI